MRVLCLLSATLVFVSSAFAAIAQSFQPPSSSPEAQSSNYTGQSNNTLAKDPVVPGKVFDRFIQIWIENTDCEWARYSLADGTVMTLIASCLLRQLRLLRRLRCSKT